MQGKIVRVEKRMANGAHETYSGRNGLLYKFNVTIEYNGAEETGEASSSKEQPSWRVGSMYTFERTARGQQGQFISFSSLKPVDQAPGGFSRGGGGAAPKRDYMSFAVQKGAECAYRVAAAFWSMEEMNKIYQEENYDRTAESFFNHIVRGRDEAGIWIAIASYDALISKLGSVGITIPVDKNISAGWKEHAESIMNHINKLLNDYKSESH